VRPEAEANRRRGSMAKKSTGDGKRKGKFNLTVNKERGGPDANELYGKEDSGRKALLFWGTWHSFGGNLGLLWG